ncbi:hypothetical protein BJP36_38985 [Moorena producens JHB]|uniref:Uncharacterized protein n=1 Tax=Moorena producens (strain JHB) TaxID=1454205 RepID=A0A9Q9UWM6_MOOP1|nr:hypothetical protein [Moorena producens]WAN70054.1 hypothetical protein BJP36_38985 [Moorena producens JHB]
MAVYPEVAQNPVGALSVMASNPSPSRVAPESAKMSLNIPNYRKLLLPSPHTLTPTPYSLLPTPLLPEACNLNFKTQL